MIRWLSVVLMSEKHSHRPEANKLRMEVVEESRLPVLALDPSASCHAWTFVLVN